LHQRGPTQEKCLSKYILAGSVRRVVRCAGPAPQDFQGSAMLSSGVVTVVQEHRFELLGHDGTRRHFTLAHDAPLGWDELIRLEHDGCAVAVRHDPPLPGHTTAAVHAIGRLRPVPATTRSTT
jgi:hypothetical protein